MITINVEIEDRPGKVTPSIKYAVYHRGQSSNELEKLTASVVCVYLDKAMRIMNGAKATAVEIARELFGKAIDE